MRRLLTTSVRPTVRTPSPSVPPASTNVVVAVDAAYGSTAGISYGGNLDAKSGTQGAITFGNAEAGVATGSLFIYGATGTSEATGAGLSYISFVTVSTATITALG